MSWLQLHLAIPRDRAPMVEDVLLAAGALSVTLADNADHPILEPGVGETPLWDDVLATGLFSANTDTGEALALLAARYPGQLPDCRWEVLADQDWERSWMAHFEPIRCGQRLWVCPSWCEPPDPGAINLILDPGLAFGSGTHPTTFLCLQWLDREPLAGKTLIDYGCGSGILGIAALLLGAARVIAVDNDPQSLIATRDNARRNHIRDEQLTVCLPQNLPPTTADVLVANILATPLIELAPSFGSLLPTGGRLCLSGIVASQSDAVVGAYHQFDFDPVQADDIWVRLAAVKRAPAPTSPRSTSTR